MNRLDLESIITQTISQIVISVATVYASQKISEYIRNKTDTNSTIITGFKSD